jgi:hypothetical protein
MSDALPETEDFESRWPNDGDRLFVEGEWAYDAYVVCNPGERSYRMPKGYKRAGDILIDQAAADVIDRPNVIYAALFCYRQCIELFLKVLIEKFRSERTQLATNTHNLRLLWERFMLIAEERGSSDSIGLSTVQELVMEMYQADQKADGFRFPTGIDGTPFLFGDRGIDLTNIREVMQGLQNFFECTYLEFSRQDELVAQMAVDYAGV